MDNQSYHKSWKEIFIDKDDVSHHEKNLGLSKDVIKLYQGFVRNHYYTSLEKMFPRLIDITELDWKTLTEKYFDYYPPQDWDLNDMTKSFPKFLEENKEELNLKNYHIELAEYELMEFFVYKSPEKNIISTYLEIHPTAKYKIFNYQIAKWVKQMDHLESENRLVDLRKSTPEDGVNILFVHRNEKTNLCLFTQIDSLMAIMIEFIQTNKFLNFEALQKNITEFIKVSENSQLQFSNIEIKNAYNFLKKQGLILENKTE